jgi:hypothetical protein
LDYNTVGLPSILIITQVAEGSIAAKAGVIIEFQVAVNNWSIQKFHIEADDPCHIRFSPLYGYNFQ